MLLTKHFKAKYTNKKSVYLPAVVTTIVDHNFYSLLFIFTFDLNLNVFAILLKTKIGRTRQIEVLRSIEREIILREMQILKMLEYFKLIHLRIITNTISSVYFSVIDELWLLFKIRKILIFCIRLHRNNLLLFLFLICLACYVSCRY